MLTLNDGRSELWQWDTGRTLAVDADCSQVHFSNKVFGRSIDVDVVDGAAIIPDVLLQTDKDLDVWAFVGTAENGYTKISKTFKVNRRNKPADYVFTPPDQTTLSELVDRIDRIEESQDPDAIKNAVDDYFKQNPVEAPVQSVNGQTGAVNLTATDVEAISQDDLQNATNAALAQAKASGEFDGAAGQDGAPGQDGITPTIGDNGNWYLGETDTGKPSRGEPGPAGADGRDGADGQPGENGTDGYSPTANVTQTDNGATITITDKNGTTTATVTNGKDGADGNPGADGSPGKDGVDGKSAYQYAVEGGYTGTEAEFAAKLAQELPTTLPNPNALTLTGAVSATYDGSAPVNVEIPAGGSGSYTLPIASATQLGGVMPAAKTDEMTQAVGVDDAGGLWALPGGGDTIEPTLPALIVKHTLTEDEATAAKFEYSVESYPELANYTDLLIEVKNAENSIDKYWFSTVNNEVPYKRNNNRVNQGMGCGNAHIKIKNGYFATGHSSSYNISLSATDSEPQCNQIIPVFKPIVGGLKTVGVKSWGAGWLSAGAMIRVWGYNE